MGTVLSSMSFAIGFSFVGLFFYSLSKHKNRVSKLFSLVSLAMAIYVIGYAFELRSQSLEWIKFFLKVEYFGLPFMFVFWLMLLHKVFLNRDPSLKLTIALMAIPVLTLFFSATNDFHHLYYADMSIVQHNGFVTAKLTKGPWYIVNTVYGFGTLLVGIGLTHRAWRRSACSKMQTVLLTIGVLVPGVVEIAYFAGLSPYGLDMTPFTSSVFAACYYVALFRYDLFELKDRGRLLGSVHFMLDITQQRQFVNQLDNLASYDGGTEIYNRRRLLEEAEREALRAHRLGIHLSVLMLDIDSFKGVNDTYGHLAGDEVLKTVVQACKRRIRSTDVIGRYGGEEFMILLPGADLENATAVAEDIRQQVESMETEHAGDRIRVTVSIGVAPLNESEGSDIRMAIDRADSALYGAKLTGRNRVVCAV